MLNFIYIMRKEIVVLPNVKNNLRIMGEQIRLARLRRNFSMELIAKRAHISRPTLQKVERGAPDVAIGTYANVLMALGGMDKDLTLVAKDDETGRTYYELGIKVKRRSSKNGK